MKHTNQSHNSSDNRNNNSYQSSNQSEDSRQSLFLNNKRDRDESEQLKCYYCNKESNDLLNLSSKENFISYLNNNILKKPYEIKANKGISDHLKTIKMPICKECLISRLFSKDDNIIIPNETCDNNKKTEMISLFSFYSVYLVQLMQRNDTLIDHSMNTIEISTANIVKKLFCEFNNNTKGLGIIEDIDKICKCLEEIKKMLKEQKDSMKNITSVIDSMEKPQENLSTEHIRIALNNVSMELIKNNVFKDYKNEINDIRKKFIGNYLEIDQVNKIQQNQLFQNIAAIEQHINQSNTNNNNSFNLNYPLTYQLNESQYPFLINHPQTQNISPMPLQTYLSYQGLNNMNQYQLSLNNNPNQIQLTNNNSNNFINSLPNIQQVYPQYIDCNNPLINDMIKMNQQSQHQQSTSLQDLNRPQEQSINDLLRLNMPPPSNQLQPSTSNNKPKRPLSAKSDEKKKDNMIINVFNEIANEKNKNNPENKDQK